MVRDGQIADGFIVLGPDRALWYDRSECEVTPQPSIDGTRRFAQVAVSGSGRDIGASSAIEAVQETATAALCAEMVGGMQWALDTTVQYVKDREAFGRPIGVFQAVQHKCADMLVQTESLAVGGVLRGVRARERPAGRAVRGVRREGVLLGRRTRRDR